MREVSAFEFFDLRLGLLDGHRFRIVDENRDDLHLVNIGIPHYNHKLRAEIDAAADNDGRYAWTAKWPKSQVDAIEGLIIRESTDNRWVTAIAWERFLSAQGHNPWECMHLSIHVGALARNETRVVRGKIYLFEGSKDDALSRFQADFRR